MLAYCDNAYCNAEIHVDEFENPPYLCTKCQDQKDQAKFSLICEDFKTNNFSNWNGWKPKKFCKPISLETKWREVRDKFWITDTDKVHFSYGKEVIRKEFFMDEKTGLKDVLDIIRRDCESFGVTPGTFLFRKAQLYVSKAIAEIVYLEQVAEGMAAFEAKFEDGWLRSSGGTSCYLDSLEADTKSVVCHSDDELPF